MQNHSNENEFDLHENERVNETNFHTNGFALRLFLKKRQESIRKSPMASLHVMSSYSKLEITKPFLSF